MSRKAKAAAVGGGVLLVAVVAFFLLSNRSASDIPIIGGIVDDPPVCALSGLEPRREALAERPAIAVKIENAEVAYPLSGLEDAEVVYEELVEGGVTRFMALYHCADSSKAGPIRSARAVDPAIMTPTTRILAFSGANASVMNALQDADVVVIEENAAGEAMARIPRAGLSFEHTLYADTAGIRRIGRKQFDDPPPEGTYAHGELEGRSRAATSVTINFSGATTVSYEWDGDGWLRSQQGSPFMAESGEQIAVDNVLIEEHDVALSEIRDVAGNPSIEIADVTGTGRAVLFRNGRAVIGRWVRDTIEGPVTFATRRGDEMTFAPGSIWIHLVPSEDGEVKGSFDFAK